VIARHVDHRTPIGSITKPPNCFRGDMDVTGRHHYIELRLGIREFPAALLDMKVA